MNSLDYMQLPITQLHHNQKMGELTAQI